MHFTHFAAAAALLLLDVATAQTTHSVVVGAGGLTFTPSQVTAAVGDTVSFEFHPKNHTLTQSTFAAPCVSMANGVNSGFMPVDANATSFPVYSFKVNQVTPLWFFCAQTGHCEQGMVMAVNVNASSPNSFDAFLTNAKNSAAGSTPSSGYGAPGASGMVTSSAAAATGSGSAAPGSAASSGFRTGTVSAGASLVAIAFGVMMGL